MTTVSPVISTTGISIPAQADIRAAVRVDALAIFGWNIVEPNDSQWLDMVVGYVNDINISIVAVYNAFNPSLAVGVGLSSNVAINSIARFPAIASTAVGTVTGVAGTVINNGQVNDTNGNVWLLPASVVIGSGGTTTGVTVTCKTIGAITAAIGAVNSIRTPVAGWTAFTNTAAAIAGMATETDAALRIRQQQSVAHGSQGMVTSMVAGVSGIPGVTGIRAYENITGVTDSNGIPAWNVCLLIAGGDATAIANAIDYARSPATIFYGGGSPVTVAVKGISILFARPVAATVAVNITIKQIVNGAPITGGAVPATTVAALQAALQAAINATPLGLGVVSFFGLAPVASLLNTSMAGTFEITALTINKNGGSFSAADVSLTFLEQAVAGTVTVTVA